MIRKSVEGDPQRAISLLSVRETPSGKHQKLYLSEPIGDTRKTAKGEPVKPLYIVTTALFVEIGAPKKGEILTPAALSAIKQDDERFRATRQAIRTLSYSDNSEGNLIRKLRGKGFSSEAAEEAAHEMVREGFLDEGAQLERRICDEVNLHHIGPQKLIPKLVAKGFRRADIERTLASLCEEGKVDLTAAKRELLAKELPKIRQKTENEQERKDAVRKLLYRNGWPLSDR